MEDGLLSLKWNNHKRTFTNSISLYRDQALYSDVTLACNGQYFHAHKIVLSSCSDYFEELFSITQCKQPVIVLKDIRPIDMKQLLQYIYEGEVEVKQSELAELLEAAECLNIKGLATPDNNTEDENPNKKKRKRKLSGDRPDLPKKQVTSTSSNVYKDATLSNQISENPSINEPKEEPADLDEIEVIGTNYELDKLEDNSSFLEHDTYEEEIPYAENKAQTDNLELTSPSTAGLSEYESMAGPSVHCEDSTFDNSTFLDESNENPELAPKNFEASYNCIKKIRGHLTIYSCTLCEFSTPWETNFKDHVLKHAREKIYDPNYTQDNKLSVEEKRKKPFMCQYCDYRSLKKSDVKRHERIHTGEKPYCCNDCSYRSAYKHDLQLHITRMHTNKSFV